MIDFIRDVVQFSVTIFRDTFDNTFILSYALTCSCSRSSSTR